MALTFADEAHRRHQPGSVSVRDSDRILGILQAKSAAPGRPRAGQGTPAHHPLQPGPRRSRRNAVVQGHPGNPASIIGVIPESEEVLQAPTRGPGHSPEGDRCRRGLPGMSSPASWAKRSPCALSTTKNRACSKAPVRRQVTCRCSPFLRQQAENRSVAKERLQLIIAHERDGASAVNFLPDLQRELIAESRSTSRSTGRHPCLPGKAGYEVLEVKIELPRRAEVQSGPAPLPMKTGIASHGHYRQGMPRCPFSSAQRNRRPRLNEHVIGSEIAKKALAVAIYGHFRRMAARRTASN